MRIKRSNALVVLLENDQFVFHNFLVQQTFSANPTALEILRRLGVWTDLEALAGSLPAYSPQSIAASVDQLKELGAILVEDSEAADREDELQQTWLWGPFAAAFHFGTRSGDYLAADAADSLLVQQAKYLPSPPLFTRNARSSTDIVLPAPDTTSDLFQTMARRRTDRRLRDEPIAVEALADCLHVSMAITALIDDPEIADLPLKMTPSGGGRNPYEAYVCVRNIVGVAPGAYHYSGMERSLGLVGPGPPPPFPDMMAGQSWTSAAAAVIFLVANFDRAMWKYHQPAAYNATMIEAGHIAQNIMLAATGHGLVANPVGALSLDTVERVLGVSGPTQAVVYALVLGVPGA
jgi:SagB-type dehydrogenase family enzyme